MSSKDKNLSSSISKFDLSEKSIGVVWSKWNEEITGALKDGCLKTLKKYGLKKDSLTVIEVPGAFELPYGAKLLLGQQKVDAVICIGCVIKGETKHDEYINKTVAQAICMLGLSSSKPVIYGVLTPNDKQQALDRAGGKYGNKGDEAAITAIEMIHLSEQLPQTKQSIGFN
jgi:6,7-dimethyl-8-ribityllumazine synthase